MDPLSGVASTFGIVSLTLQLAQSALSIKRFIDAFHNAPTEIIRLKSLFHQLHLVAQTIASLLQTQQSLQSRSAQVTSNIHESLRTCQEIVDLICKSFQLTQKTINEQSHVPRNWTQLKLACKKKKIEEFERQLEQAISILNMNLLVNLLIRYQMPDPAFPQQFTDFTENWAAVPAAKPGARFRPAFVRKSPLQYGVFLNKQRIVRMLIQRGADPTYTSAAGWSLLHYMFDKDRSAANAQYFSVFHDCLIFDEVQDSEGWTSLHRCAAFGKAEDIHSLHQVGAPAYTGRYTTVWGGSPMHVAAMHNNVSTLDGLFSLADGQLDALDAVDNQGWTPLHISVYHGAEDAMKWLLKHGADPHRKTYRCGWFPDGHEGEVFNVADLAVLSGATCYETLVKVLKDTGYDITADGHDIYWGSV
ncbi:hypothetical protein NPX13_g7496 [Xylaria arbuscula]|uniref:Fungal N-terminal domain-containing protein n=1 Tax=Xylaria arbuscula TaxID=114810 RepID=A0A9W8N9W3_9PEZI|nr:hypothetical protein NPX13_g7496 [Xylaria arbuscula]